VALRVSLVWPYVIRLADPVPMVSAEREGERLALPLRL
jgi:hypothetical protein